MVIFKEGVAVLEQENDVPALNHFNQVVEISDVDLHGLEEAVHEAVAVVVHTQVDLEETVLEEVALNTVLDRHPDDQRDVVSALPVNFKDSLAVLARHHFNNLLDI